jgi:uncharacterized membrane protein
MSEVDAEALVREYLARLEAAAAALPQDRRDDLARDVRQHIESALAEAGRADEVTVRNIIERLGPVDEIVAAEVAAATAAPPPYSGSEAALAQRDSRWGAVEIIALLLVTLGAVLLPIIGPLVGLVFVWASARWTTRQKLFATLIVVVLLILPILLLFPVALVSGTPGPIETGPLAPEPQ